jgi:hypothetical protein
VVRPDEGELVLRVVADQGAERLESPVSYAFGGLVAEDADVQPDAE